MPVPLLPSGIHNYIQPDTLNDMHCNDVLNTNSQIINTLNHFFFNNLFFFLQDCQTRWGSTYQMVERLIDHNNGQYIRDILGADAKTKHLVPSWADLDVLDCLKKALGPLAELTYSVQSARHFQRFHHHMPW